MKNKLLDSENQFVKKGYHIFDTSKQGFEAVKYLRKKIVNIVFKKYPKIKAKFKNENQIFEKMHSYIPKKNLNEFRLEVIDVINNDEVFANNYYLAAKEGLDLLVGNEIAMQKKLNVTIQMPNDKN